MLTDIWFDLDRHIILLLTDIWFDLDRYIILLKPTRVWIFFKIINFIDPYESYNGVLKTRSSIKEYHEI